MQKKIFYQELVIVDTETTSLELEEAEIVEVGNAVYTDCGWTGSSILLGARNGIPPEASAVNNISNQMIAGLDHFDQKTSEIQNMLRMPDIKYLVAHNAAFDRRALSTAFTRAGSREATRICESQKRWLCTWRLARAILAPDFPNLINFQLNYLRYFFDLDTTEVNTHRAEADCLICAKLLEMIVDYGIASGRIIENNPIGPQLIDICWGHIPVTKFPIGKHKGLPLKDIPTDYYMWAINNMSMLKEGDLDYDADLAESVRNELESRLN